MTSTPITLKLKPTGSEVSTDTEAGAALRKQFPASILREAEKIYGGESALERDGRDLRNPAAEFFLGTRLDSKGNTVHANSALDLGGVLQLRQKKIAELMGDKTFRESLMAGPDTAGRYSQLSWWDRHIHKISDEDLTKALHRYEITRRENDPGLQDLLEDLTPEQIQKIERNGGLNLTEERTIRNMAEASQELEALTERIRAMDHGQTDLDALLAGNGGKPLTKQQLLDLETRLKPRQTKAIRAGQLHDSQLLTEQTTRDVNTGTLELAQQKERNANALANSEIAFGNRKLDYEWRNAQAERDYQYSRDEADRDLKKTLTMLGFDDRRDERRERSEERAAEQRQLFILQLMKGLGSLGQSIGGSL